MTLLRRYIWRAVIMPALALAGILLLLDGLISFVLELESLRNDYQVWQALQYVVTTMPRKLADFLPLAILLGALVGLGLLANSGELTVMRAAGVSSQRITVYVLRPSVVLLCGGLLIAEFVVPFTEQIARTNRSLATSGGEAQRSGAGLWHREGDEFIYISAVEANGVLHGITRYRFDDQRQLLESQFIRRAIWQGEDWALEDIRGTRPEGERFVRWQRDSGRWALGLTPDVLSILTLKPEHLALTKLYGYARYLTQQGIDGDEYLLVFWQKLSQPVGVLGMVMIATTFIFGPLRQVSMGLRLTAGIGAGLLFHYGQQFIGQLSLVFDMAPLWAAWAPAVFTVLVGVVLLQRVR